MTTRVLDNALDAAHSTAQAIGEGISDLLPDQLVPFRHKPRNRGRVVGVVSTLVIVAAGLLIATRKRLSERPHQLEPNQSADDANDDAVASSPPAQPGRKAERGMSQADRANGEPAALRV